MDRKTIIAIVRILLGALTLSLAALFLLPVVLFLNTPPVPRTAEVLGESSRSVDAYRWILKHLKLSATENGAVPDLLILTDSQIPTREVSARLGHNRVVGEMLLGRSVEQPDTLRYYSHLFSLDFQGVQGMVIHQMDNPSEVPGQIIDAYEKQTGSPWRFMGEGIVLTSPEQVMVLEAGKDYSGTMLYDDGSQQVPYKGWFEVVQSSNPVQAEFRLETTEEGHHKLSVMGMSNRFPAVVTFQSPLYTAMYHAGDFAGSSISMPYYYSLAEPVMKLIGQIDSQSPEFFFWNVQYERLKALATSAENSETAQTRGTEPNVKPLEFSVSQNQIMAQPLVGSPYPFFVQGVNLGPALPGKSFTEMPRDYGVYRTWLEQMGQLNVNSLRVYTLLPPEFYRALYDYNLTAPVPLYLLQEIWPEEHPENLDYLDPAYDAAWKKEIELTVAAVHGEIMISERKYRSHGLYAYDVSPWVMAYLVGREMEPDEVLATDARHQGYSYSGTYFYTEPHSTPTEAWLAESCDYALQQDSRYSERPPLIAVVNWPTLDPMDHPSEWNPSGNKALQGNDKAVVDIGRIGTHTERVPGFFGAYHIYPNYPDFMNNNPEYDHYADVKGRFRYGGYLKQFIAQHTRYPALVAEYGISTSMVTAHLSPDGYHHGGLSEAQQAEGIIRMTEAIRREGYAGAVVFQWMDEWVKKTWSTEPLMIPYDRHSLWHNAMDPEQNYGLMGVRSARPAKAIRFPASGDLVDSVTLSHDMAFVNLKIQYRSQEAMAQSLSQGTPLRLELDTAGSSGPISPEFLLEIGTPSLLKVKRSYNWASGRFDASPSQEPFESMTFKTNPEAWLKSEERISPKAIDLSILREGPFDDSRNQVELRGISLHIRIPYMQLGISDPSSLRVLNDPKPALPPTRDSLLTEQFEGIRGRLLQDDLALCSFAYQWQPWNEPEYVITPKASFFILADYFKAH